MVGVEAGGDGKKHAARLTGLGKLGVLHGMKTYLLEDKNGQITETYSISAGLDYPGVGPLHANLFESGRGTFLSATDEEALQAAFHVSKTEGIIPALETAHAFAVLGKLNLEATDNVVVCLSGRGDKDLATYMKEMSL